MITYFESFDLHVALPGGLDTGAGQDMSDYWSGGSPSRFSYTEGYETGQGLVIDGALNWASNRGRNPASPVFRMGWWGRGIRTGEVEEGYRELVFHGGERSTGYGVFVNQLGQLYLFYRPLVNEPVVLLGLPSAPVFSDEYKHYEFYSNTLTGRIELRVNQVLVLQATAPVFSGFSWRSVNLGEVNLGPFPWAPVFSHIYFTDGPALSSQEVLAVSVSAAADRFEGVNGLRGTLMMEGDRYTTDWSVPTISTVADPVNQVNVQNYFFFVDPSTGEAWTKNGLDLVTSWGVCFQRFLNDPGRVRMVSLSFNYLDYNDGRPVVRHQGAAGLTEFSGPWEKSNPELSLTGHVSSVPRKDDYLKEDTTSLYIGSDGCVLFGRSPDGTIDPPELLKVGVTFAEEFREDNRDWVRVTGSGNSFESMFVSGYSVLGEGNKKFQNNFVTVNYENVPTGSCYIQGVWDYAEQSDTGRWSMRQVIENRGGDYKHGFRRLKIRGHGKAMQLRVLNKGDDPFTINGWSMFITGNTGV